MNEIHHLASVLRSSIANRSLAGGRAVHARLVKLDQNVGKSFSLHNKLVYLYSQCGLPKPAHKLFDIMPERDVVSFNTLISAHPRLSSGPFSPLTLYTRLLDEGLRPNCITLASLLSGSNVVSNVQLLETLHCHSIKFGLSSNGYVGSAIVNGYEKYRGLKDALRAFGEMKEVDSVSWNIMIDACARSRSKEAAVEIYARMKRENRDAVDCFTLTSILKICDESKDLGLGMQLHACALKGGLEHETPVGNALVTMYSRCDGDLMSSALLVFRMIREPNVISWTAIINGLAQSGMAEEAMQLYKNTVTVVGMENEFMFASVLPAVSATASLEFGRTIHARIVKRNFCSDCKLSNALIDMYFKCGELEDAKLVFATTKTRDLVSWTVMITGLGHHGMASEALETLKAMIKTGLRPDSVTFQAGLSACNHGGLVEEGMRLFRSMVDEYKMRPRREHFACVVDMLGRAGRLVEAETFLKETGIEGEAFLWETLLGACRTHGEVEVGERVAKKVMELEPESDGVYVQLANMYADRDLWEEKGNVRHRLDTSGLRKETGRSWL